jgi:hypothetical protein
MRYSRVHALNIMLKRMYVYNVLPVRIQFYSGQTWVNEFFFSKNKDTGQNTAFTGQKETFMERRAKEI